VFEIDFPLTVFYGRSIDIGRRAGMGDAGMDCTQKKTRVLNLLEKAVVHETHETVLAGNPQSECSQKT